MTTCNRWIMLGCQTKRISGQSARNAPQKLKSTTSRNCRAQRHCCDAETTAGGRCWVCVFVSLCVCVMLASLLLPWSQWTEERVPQSLLQGDPPTDVVLQHTAEQVQQLPVVLTLSLHVLLRDRRSLLPSSLRPLANARAWQAYLERFAVLPDVIVRGTLLIPVEMLVLNILFFSR